MDGAFRAAVHRDAVQCRLGPDGPPSHTHSKEKTRQMTSVRRMLTGFLLAIAAGFGWGSMGVAAQVMTSLTLAIRRKPVRIAMPSEHGRSTDLFARTVVTERTATSMEVGICNVWVVC